MAIQHVFSIFRLQPAAGTLVQQLVDAISRAAQEGQLSAGERLWSIRQLSRELGISTFTVAEAYDRLVATGIISARRGEGFYLAGSGQGRPELDSLPPLPAHAFWLADSLYEPPPDAIKPGSGWLPPAWFADMGLERGLRQVARSTSGGELAGYGEPGGLPALRDYLVRELGEAGLPLSRQQLVLTQGASQALTLALACLTRPGDCVLVDDPGYCNLVIGLPLHGIQPLGVPWTPQGPDLVALEALLEQHRPKVFFTNPRLHNPTGASYSAATAHRVLQLAEKYDFWIVEDDVCAGLSASSVPSLAALDGLRRVVHVGSFSKTLSPGLRVGFVAAERGVAEALIHHKMVYGLTSSELAERVALAALSDGQQRRRIARLRARLAEARAQTLSLCARQGLDVFAAGSEGMFVWARLPQGCDGVALSAEGVKEGVMLAPGALFRPGQQASDYLRLNVAYSAEARVEVFLAQHLGGLQG
ncbi:aminotransferase-like domain-containing protein [Craterilacuibacter sinensis]|uniref:Putative 8-amino-7-oxononanoate synthase n=1 Tax=Craterilacuibacter sinensis TaxID=2686017 RepID=A0A845BUB6_9NEIS|nr:PLP-dependent aminotransferase family protein [Craterilacuibacter sinensis]MXR38201.1 aminotransferase class I/II-fold pyridoxal phosphate-dependent enzyme [Craterilacuibacter sinensis]